MFHRYPRCVSLHSSISAADAVGFCAPDEVATFSGYYPEQPGLFRHSLCEHPLLSLDALVTAAESMVPDHVECRRAMRGNGGGFDHRETPGSKAEALLGIAEADCWVMLRFIEQLPEYAALLSALADELGPAIRAETGEMQQLRGFVFVSSPGVLTPFHFDPEHNILFHLAGNKTFATYPAASPWLTAQSHHKLHADGDNLLPWRADFAAAGKAFELAPGDALYVPYKAPHWVRAGQEPCISLSVTWKSAAAFAQDDAWRCNALLGRLGIAAAPPHPLPRRSWAKAAAFRALRRARLA